MKCNPKLLKKEKKKNVQKISCFGISTEKREVKGKNKMKEKMINPNNS